MNLDAIIREVQGVVGVAQDGRAGPKTWLAIHGALTPKKVPPAPIVGEDAPVDDRSEKTIATLLPEVRPYARALIHAASAQGIEIKAISGTRTYDEQNALYEQGRTKPGSIVTNARGGQSNHNFGIAWDVGVFDGTRYLGESKQYAAVGSIGKSLGLEWGGSWKTIEDQPHWQLRPAWAKSLSESDMLSELRHRKETGIPVFA